MRALLAFQQHQHGPAEQALGKEPSEKSEQQTNERWHHPIQQSRGHRTRVLGLAHKSAHDPVVDR